MNVMFDFNHPVDVNFFKNSIKVLALDEKNKIFIVYRSRGKLDKIINSELKHLSPIKIGLHRKSFLGKVFGQLYRDFLIFCFQRKMKIDLCVCFGSTSAISSWINGIPYLAFDDDYEYKIPFYHANIFSTFHIMPDFIKYSNSKVFKYKGFKELAYLHPKYFKINNNFIQKNGLEKNKYVFIREISSVSLNYRNKDNHLKKIITKLNSLDYKVVLSLEDDLYKKDYIDHCIVLEEPVECIFSIIANSSFTISSGDTMARESCLLGVPCIYTGDREMEVNKELIELEIMFKQSSIESIFKKIDFLSKDDYNSDLRYEIQKKINDEWDDTTDVILSYISRFKK